MGPGRRQRAELGPESRVSPQPRHVDDQRKALSHELGECRPLRIILGHMKCIGAVFHTWCCLTALKALKTAQPGDALESHSSFDMLALAKLGTVWPKNVSAKEFEPSNSQKSPSLAPEAPD